MAITENTSGRKPGLDGRDVKNPLLPAAQWILGRI